MEITWTGLFMTADNGNTQRAWCVPRCNIRKQDEIWQYQNMLKCGASSCETRIEII